MTIVDGSVIKSYFETGDVPTETQFSNMIDTFLQIQDSWVLDEDDWVYVSANSFKIEGKDVTSKFPTGTKIKCTNSTVKYFNVVSSVFSTDTTVTIFGAGTYSLANTAISSNYYSYAEFARSFPSLMTTLSQLQTGWILDSNTWIYSSATSITVSGKDVTSYFPIGTKIKFTQTTVKYFVVANASYASDTILTLTGDTVANATINDFYYSHAMVANGAPDTGGVWKNWTPNYTQYGTMTYTSITTHTAKYSKVGNLCFFKIDSAGTLGGTPISIIYFSPPITPNPAFNGYGFVFNLGVVLSGVLQLGFGNSNSSGSVFQASKFDKSNFSAGAIRFIGYGFYEIA